ncbi:MAG TPA: DUF6184 family natural product biosynthesis lipoprotein [Polyangiaceae bacterium]
MRQNSLVNAFLIGSTISLCACNRTADKPTVQPASAPREERVAPTGHDVASARDAIVNARCAREQRCDNVGDNKTYSSHQDCINRIRADWKDDLNSRECSHGIKQSQLDECLAKVRGEQCGNPFDTLSRVAECTVGQICSD